MRRSLTLLSGAALVAGLALAETFSGTLIDLSCYDQQKNSAACSATGSTTSFGIDVSGKVFKLDSDGNAKAAEALKGRADRSANPNAPASNVVAAKINGSKAGDDTIKVDSIEVQ